MFDIVLAESGATFVTRQRARSLVRAAREASPAGDPCVDLSGVTVSPSFLAEFLQELAGQYVAVVLVGGSDYVRNLAESLIERLGLAGRVTVAAGAAA